MRALSPADRTWGVLVDGIGGIGKSAITIEAAYRAQEASTFEAFLFVTAKTNILDPSGIKELNTPARTLDEFLNETARVLGQPGIAKLIGNEKRRALIDVLRSMRTLLVYDNLETLSKEEQEGIADFLRELPQGCKAIITSRRRGGEGGVWLRLEKLDWDARAGIIENEMTRDMGLASKLNHLQSRWQELFDETNGSPLALMHTLGLMRVRTALNFKGALEMLRGNRDEDLQKFIFQEARKELTENDKRALGALSFFAPSSTFEAWMLVANLSRNALEITIERLSALSLVDVLSGEERYALHPLTRIFVRNELFTDENVVHKMGVQFSQYWIDYASRFGTSGKEGYKNYERLESEWSNVHAALDWLWMAVALSGSTIRDQVSASMMIKFLTHVSLFLSFSGRLDEKTELHSRCYETAIILKNWDSAGWSAYDLAWTCYYRKHNRQAIKWAERCFSAWSNTRSILNQAAVQRLRGLIAQQEGKFDKANTFFIEALRLYKGKGRRLVSRVFNDLGRLAQERRQYKSARSYYNRALNMAYEAKDKLAILTYRYNLGLLFLDEGKDSKAREEFEQILPLSREIGILEKIAQVEYGFACAHEEMQIDLALPLAQDALKIYGRLQHADLAEIRKFVEKLKKIKRETRTDNE